MLLGFPEVDEGATPIEKEIISTFLVRIAYSFSALLSMRNVMLWRKLGAEVPIDDHAIRQYILELQAKKINEMKLETRELLELASDSLCSSRKIISQLIKENERTILPERPRLDDFDLLELGDHAFDKVLDGKEQLKEDGLDIDKFTIDALRRKWERVQRKIEVFHSRQIRNNYKKMAIITLTAPSYYTRRESLLRRALNLKLAEEMKRVGLYELNDFGMIVTSNRRSMNKYFDTERLAYDATTMTERFNRKLKVGTKEFAVEVGETMAAYHSMTEDSLRSVSHKPWFQRYFGDNLDYMLNAFRKQKEELRARQTKERDELNPFAFDGLMRELEPLE
jgi:hypothetical protein